MPHCAPIRPACRAGFCTTLAQADFETHRREAPPLGVPPGNTPGEAPPRPSTEAADEMGRRLFDAIRHDDPARVADLFFPREAFLILKRGADPGRYWDRLHARFADDIHALHRSLPGLARGEFEGLEIVPRGGWVGVGEEGNALPYWASRHSRFVYRDGAGRHEIEVRVLITWADRWYLIHLNEFR
jgi:hypothetical protein